MLDLTDPIKVQRWGYTSGEKTMEMKQLAELEKVKGFNAIRFYSEREVGGVNIAVLNNFNEVLKPKMVTPVKK